MGSKELQGGVDMKKYLIIILSAIAVAVIAMSAYFTNFYYHLKSLQVQGTKYPSTYFINPPSNLFIECRTTDDCIKIKGTACPPSKGGTETCVNKGHMQEYLSSIESLAGKEWEVDCPNVNKTTDKVCSCANNFCSLVRQ